MWLTLEKLSLAAWFSPITTQLVGYEANYDMKFLDHGQHLYKNK